MSEPTPQIIPAEIFRRILVDVCSKAAVRMIFKVSIVTYMVGFVMGAFITYLFLRVVP